MEFSRKDAIYLQIADFICEQIVLDKWQAQDKIPSVRELAVSMGVNPNTVVRTYHLLEQKGVIYKERGIGFYPTEDAKQIVLTEKTQEFIAQDLPEFFKKIYYLGLNLNDIQRLYEETDYEEE